MELPPNLQSVFALRTTAGSVDLVAGPGAGLRFRVWAWGMAYEKGQAGDLDAWLGWTSGTNFQQLAIGLSDEQRSAYLAIPGGLAWATNQEIKLSASFSAAVTGVNVFVLYTVEGAS